MPSGWGVGRLFAGNLWRSGRCCGWGCDPSASAGWADVLGCWCAAVGGGGGDCVGNAVMWKFFWRFGGEVSAEQKLADLGRRMPVWLQPVWKYLVEWFVLWVREQRVQAEVRDVDQQAVAIDQQWTQVEDGARVATAEEAAARIQFENPDATVSVITTSVGEGSDVAILVEHPADGSKAQEVLGGAMEIRNPWVERKS
jgi:hypothetical protein